MQIGKKSRLKVYHHINSYKKVSKSVVTVGTFDGVHIGHQQILNLMKKKANEINGETVLLTFYPHPRMILFPNDNSLKLINTIEERIELLDRFGLDNLIIQPFDEAFSRLSPTEYIRDILVNAIDTTDLVIGYDHQFGRNRAGNFELLSELSNVYGYHLTQLDAQQVDEITVSSTKVRKAISKGNIETALEFLNHEFSISGTVITGKQLGRTIGFPTANIKINEPFKLIPPKGAYIVKAIFDGVAHPAMLNIGNNPTVNDDNAIRIEVHIINGNFDLYNKSIKIHFLKRLRNEKAFENVIALKNQLIEDKNNALDYFAQHT